MPPHSHFGLNSTDLLSDRKSYAIGERIDRYIARIAHLRPKNAVIGRAEVAVCGRMHNDGGGPDYIGRVDQDASRLDSGNQEEVPTFSRAPGDR